MQVKEYNGNKFNNLRTKEKLYKYYERTIPIVFDTKETIFDKKCKCGSVKWKKVFYTNKKAYKMCVKCKADLGDYNE